VSTRLYHDGLQIERFYADGLGAFADELASMLRFALPDHSDDLQYHDCRHQILNGVDGRFILLFGGLERVKQRLDDDSYENLSLGICKAFYLLKHEDYDGFANTIHELNDVFATGVRHKKTANDQ
jgi:hypothetical protein